MALSDFKNVPEMTDDDIKALAAMIDPEGGDFQAITVARLLRYIGQRWLNDTLNEEYLQ